MDVRFCLREQVDVHVGGPATHNTQQHMATHAATHHNMQQLQSTDVLLCTKVSWSCTRCEQDSDECQGHTWHGCYSQKLGQ